MTTRALVLGGGGPVGIAWEAGLLTGLAEGGADLSNADFIVGTSAGSFVGAQLALGHEPAAIARPLLARAEPSSREAPQSNAGAAYRPPDLTPLMVLMEESVAGKRPAEEIRRDIGAFALKAETMSEDAFIASFGHLLRDLPENAWPERGYACTAVDALTGAFVVWNQEAHVGLARAVASSCSVPGVYPPITINGRRYVDGGMRSSTNVDVAKGYDIVTVVAVTTGVGDAARNARLRERLDAEIAELRENGSAVEVITPDAPSQEAFGANLMDFRRRPAAVEAGMAQGRAAGEPLAAFWNA